MTSASARFAINLCASGGIILSSVATRYQLGLDFQAALPTTPLSAPSPHGTWESPMKAARPGSTSAANESANFVGSRKKKAILRRQNRRYRSPGNRIFDQHTNRLAV